MLRTGKSEWYRDSESLIPQMQLQIGSQNNQVATVASTPHSAQFYFDQFCDRDCLLFCKLHLLVCNMHFPFCGVHFLFWNLVMIFCSIFSRILFEED